MSTSVGIYDDSTLPAIIQSIDLLQPWPRTLSVDDFVGATKPIKQVPLLSWVVQYSETDIRSKLTTYLQTIFTDYTSAVATSVSNLPDSMVNNVLANLAFGVTTLYRSALLPRIDNTFSTSIYALAPLWVGYYLFGALQTDIEEDTSNEGKYRYKQLSDLRELVGYTIRTILSGTSTIEKGSNVIVAATQSTEQRIVIYTDNSLLSTYVNNGGSLNTLGSQWITNKYNPVVNG